MFTGKPEVNDINVKIRLHHKDSLKDVAARTVLLLAIAWLAHTLFSVWIGGFWAYPIGAYLFTLGVSIPVALCLYVPLWREHRRTLKYLKETKRRLEISVSVPPPH